MNFLQPFVLLGLAAAAIPVILHLLTLRRLRVVEFSTLTFLRELQRSRIHRLRLQQWLLLAIRTLLITAIVMAFARPMTRGTLPLGWGTDARTTAVILLDDSYSMTAIDNEGELLRQARTAGEGILDALRTDDDAVLLPLSAVRQAEEGAYLARRIPPVRQELRRLSLSSVTRPLVEGLRSAARILGDSRNANKEVYVISDFQAGLFPTQQAPQEMLFEPNVRLFTVRLGDRIPGNLSITSPKFPGAFVDRGRPFSLMANISNRSPAPMVASVSMFKGDDRVDQRSLSMNPGESRSLEISLTADRPGFLSARMVLEGDDLDFDNVLHISLRVRDALRILLIGSEADFRYIRLALTTRSDSASTGLSVTQTDFPRLTASQFATHDVAFIAGGGGSAPLWRDRLRDAIANGLGVVLLPSAHQSGSMGGFLQLAGMNEIDTLPSALPAGTTLSFRSVDVDHPLFAGMFAPTNERPASGRTRPSIASPDIFRSIAIRPPAGQMPIITLSDGRPFILERTIGQGKVLVFSSALTPEWTTLPTQGLFVPLIHRCVAHASRSQDIRPHVTAGDEAIITLTDRSAGPLKIIRPNGSTSAAVPMYGPEGSILRFSDTRMPGFYDIAKGPTIVDRFSVDLSPSESETSPSTPEQRQSLWASVGLSGGQVRDLHHELSMKEVVQEARLGAELWKHFIVAALLLAVAESVVAQRWSRRLSKSQAP